MHNIHIDLHPNPPMKATPYLPFIWICKVVNSLVQMKLKFPIRGQVVFVNITFLWRFWWLLCLFVFAMFYLISLLTPGKMKIALSSRSWDFWLNFKFLYTVFFWFIHSNSTAFPKSLRCNQCLLGVPPILCMHL